QMDLVSMITTIIATPTTVRRLRVMTLALLSHGTGVTPPSRNVPWLMRFASSASDRGRGRWWCRRPLAGRRSGCGGAAAGAGHNRGGPRRCRRWAAAAREALRVVRVPRPQSHRLRLRLVDLVNDPVTVAVTPSRQRRQR